MIHLHTHSQFSLRDSIIRPDELVKRLKEIDQNAVAITDHGSSLGGISIYKALKEAGIKYIHGVEFYICDDVNIKDKENKYYHLVALCKNEVGRINMNRLISLSEHPDNKYFKPRIDFNMLSEYGEGLIIMSACMAGEISKCFLSGRIDDAKRVAQKYKDRFGDDYYLEVQAHNDEEQIKLNLLILELANELSIKAVVTTDAHYTYEEDRKYQNKYAFNGSYKEDGEAYIDCFVQSESEVRERLKYLPNNIVDSLINTTHEVAQKCDVDMPLSAPIMPKIETPKEYNSNYDWLIYLCKQGFRNKLNIDVDTCEEYDVSRKIFQPVINGEGEVVDYIERHWSKGAIKKYVSRYEYEIEALSKMGFIDYILLVYSYANIGERRGIARGSGGGSLVCYVTNITDIDPIEHGLYFERFIDVGALPKLQSGEITIKELKIPDIDLDFSASSCEKVLRFLYDTYGEEKVASIGKFGTNKTKGTIRDMCKVLDINLETADKIAKAFEDFELDDIDNMINGNIDIMKTAEKAIEYVELYPELFEYVRKLNGLPKSFGLHACGKIISTRELDYYLPSCYDKNGIRFLQGDMHDVEDVGLVKIDLLGLRTLDHEYDSLNLANESIDFISPKQDFTNEKVLNIFRNGDTIGIFQFSSPGMRQVLKKMQPSGINDISVANALFRPGSMAYINNFCDRKHGVESYGYLHNDLEPILNKTYGIIVFQEQVIEIGRMAGMHNPDMLRKATAKKKPELLAKVKPELHDNLIKRGWSEEQFDILWKDMLEFAKYSFNKSHAAAYAILAYQTAKIKAYYPVAFYAGLCNSFIGESSFVKDEADKIIQDAFRHNVIITPFDYRQDHRQCSINGEHMIYAIPLIRDCNSATAEILYENSNFSGKFFWQLACKLIESGMDESKLKILVKLDFFRAFANSRTLINIIDFLDFMKFGERKSVKKSLLTDGDFLYNLIDRHSISVNKQGKPLQTFTIQNMSEILSEYEMYVKSLLLNDFDYTSKAATQKEYLGFISLVTGKEEDRPKLYITAVYPLCRRKDNVQFGYSVVGKSIGSGKETRYTVLNRIYNDEPIKEGDVIKCLNWIREGKYFKILSYERIIS